MKFGEIKIIEKNKDKETKGNIEFSEEREVKDIIVSKTVSNSFDVPIQTPISGNMDIRDDIDVKEGIIQGTVLLINPSETFLAGLHVGTIFSEETSGEFVIQSITRELSGGEVSAPYLSYSVNFIGVSKKAPK